MLGKPIFKYQDQVSFTTTVDGEEKTLKGVVYVVDIYGIEGQYDEPSYDIEAFYEGEVRLFKHIPESKLAVRGN